ncbi:6-phosphogluconolactonase [Marinicellulosiphila megalodicopiae]|uniref:6-phosphogluconolactonase n=1 Tax=Marinicellulosiphila megalodicopiae TaxID=2724896 RepID=UPI003BB1BEB0
MSLLENKFASKAELETQLAKSIIAQLSKDIEQSGKAVIAVSGGSTPKALFEELSNTDIDWSKVVVTLIDERWVDNQHADSNEKLVRENLLKNKAANATFLALKTDDATPEQGMATLEPILNEVISANISVSILGMGGDSHTASFFPGATTLFKAIDLDNKAACQNVTPLTAPHERMTLTRTRILASNLLAVHITGDDKLEVFESAKQSADFNVTPISSILSQTQKDVQLFWAP